MSSALAVRDGSGNVHSTRARAGEREIAQVMIATEAHAEMPGSLCDPGAGLAHVEC